MTHEHNPLAQEMTAQLQLGLYGTVGSLAQQLRSLDALAPKLVGGGLVRPLAIDQDRQRDAIGISAASKSIKAFAGLLFGIGCVAHRVSTRGSDIAHLGQQSRMDVGDLSWLEYQRRIEWRQYRLVYELLEEIFDAGDLPGLIILDAPLVMGREVYAQSLAGEPDEDFLVDEMAELRNNLEAFWGRHIERCFPFDPQGPRIVTLRRGRFAHLLKLVQADGAAVSLDTISPSCAEEIRSRWNDLQRLGVDRVVQAILGRDQRTAAFDYGNLDKRSFPQALIEKGSQGFHYRTGLRGEPVQVEVLGDADAWEAAGGSVALDELAADLVALTFFDNPRSLPLPLWYARDAVKVVKAKGVLEFYRNEALRTMQGEQLEQTWLSGWEE